MKTLLDELRLSSILWEESTKSLYCSTMLFLLLESTSFSPWLIILTELLIKSFDILSNINSNNINSFTINNGYFIGINHSAAAVAAAALL